ncbi:carbohydrate ABC transporter permease [Paenibacillus sp.]|uniref:carbohydrate ABC transporter permease n=1 Tax=Paenibacillus sp. TaxID=58172 RepID=UPI002D7516A9|nr:carbohydrate ABC transporter permease [Paenibacillus sp.]HZG87771.1 carbohydrate ABC transporter permease [Paenibacillus sp.]
MTRSARTGQAARLLFLGFVAAISVVPFLWTLMSSMKSNRDILTSAFTLPSAFGFDNYAGAFDSLPLGVYYGNSLIVSALCIVVSLAVFSMSAYVFARFHFRGKAFLYVCLSMSLLIPVTAIIFPIYIFVKAIGLYDTKIGLVLVYAALSMPVVIYIMRSYFLTIPKEIEEAAYLDGAGFAGTFLRIMLPLSAPVLASSAVLVFLTAWNDFLYALVLTTGDSARTVPVALTAFQSMYGSNYGQLFAASVVVVLPSVVIFLLLQRKIESALVAGAVKG